MNIRIGHPRLVRRRGERGQTILLVALAVTTLLGMAALAIDVVSLYTARNEAQRAADAAALAGAKIFVNSEITSYDLAGSPFPRAEICSSSGGTGSQAANLLAEGVAHENLIAGQPATIQSITCTMGEARNPQITVTVQQTGLPNFFSRLWNRAGTTVRATATAEAYNASGLANPVQVRGVKPWLLPNCYSAPGAWGSNCVGAPKFINSDGTVSTPASFIGKTIELTQINCPTAATSPGCGAVPSTGFFYSMDIAQNSGAPVCASAGANYDCSYTLDVHDYGQNIACANPQPLTCGQTIGGAGANAFVWANGSAATNTRQTRHAVRCLIHEDSGDDALDLGQDLFHHVPNPPVTIEGGYNNPSPDLQGAISISRSDSIVTVPLYDGVNPMCSGGACTATTTIVGFLQLGVTCSLRNDQGCVNPTGTVGPQPQVEAVVLNAVGCAPGASGNPVTGTGTSPVAVRLIH